MTKNIILILIISILLTGCTSKEIEIEKSSIIEENLHNFNRNNSIVEDFDGYFQYINDNNEKIPVLVHITFDFNSLDYNNQNYDKISQLISNLKISLIGIDGELKMSESYSDEFIFSQMFSMNSKSNQLVESIENEAGIAFLKENFRDEITINKIDDEKIEYKVKNQVQNIFFGMRFTKDEKNDRIILELTNL